MESFAFETAHVEPLFGSPSSESEENRLVSKRRRQIQAVSLSREVPRFVNPISNYFVNEILFEEKIINGKGTYQMPWLYSYHKVKIPTSAIIDKKHHVLTCS